MQEALDITTKGTLWEQVRAQSAVATGKSGAVEVFGGSCQLTRALASCGFAAVGVDFRWNRHKPVATCKWIDLGDSAGLRHILELFRRVDVGYVHFGPPNGTSSAGRNTDAGRPALRSDEFPDGLPSLKDSGREEELAAVQRDNTLYHHVAALVVWLSWNRVLWTIESPSSSHIWDTAPFRCLCDLKEIGALKFSRTSGSQPSGYGMLWEVGSNR
jgi:hypothetical protein